MRPGRRALALGLLAALAGCPGAPPDPDDTARYHPDGWSAAEAHGLAAKLQQSSCVACHGDDLTGGSGPGCDGCHAAGWRSNCTFCHGGADDASGAPPVGIDPAVTDLSFDAHAAHLQPGDHPNWGCDVCHTPPVDALTPGHLFVTDATPAVAEVTFALGLSRDGAYEGGGTCANLYCHGDGGGHPGDARDGEATTCESCHGGPVQTGTLSGAHAEHLAQDSTCADCHADTAAGNLQIRSPDLHVDGAAQTAFPSGVVWDGATCTGTCHDVLHGGSTWVAGRFHPPAWDEPAPHGQAAKLQILTCAPCHGVDLRGGTSGQGCDECHQDEWRTDCTYCHGGAEDATGAPPVGFDDTNPILAFDAHAKHGDQGNHATWTCDQCHEKPVDALAPGHLFVGDDTPGEAEVDLSAGLSPEGRWDAESGCSAVYCHGDGAGRLGDVRATDEVRCDSCHGDPEAPERLSPVHGEHAAKGATCDECHADTVGPDEQIATPALHVDGVLQTRFASDMGGSLATCTGTCHEVEHDASRWLRGGFHPEGWDDAQAHGVPANLRSGRVCTDCHGVDLRGTDDGPACDDCHQPDWRTDCTYCHGGVDDETGAPPQGIGAIDAPIAFDAHGAHLSGDHAPYDCDQCHVTPTDLLSLGHVYAGDDTPGEVEVDFTSGLSADATRGGDATCGDLYCHGDGAGALGDASDDLEADCASCHGDVTAAGRLSSVHAAHVTEGATCGDCHADTVTGDEAVTGPDLHVDGAVQTAFPSGMTYVDGLCTGTCHDMDHAGADWAHGAWHPDGWEAAESHGDVANSAGATCDSCHGADLAGGTSGVGCDGCHAAGWRTDCTYCHGGVDNLTGAPPRDVTAIADFPDHTEHVSGTDHPAWGCAECHVKPTDVMSPGHVYVGDTTPGDAEVTFVAGLSSAGTYDTTGTCGSSYCHGNGARAGSLRTLGTVSAGGTTTCATCHGDAAAPRRLTQSHDKHVRDLRSQCVECHAAVMVGNSTIRSPDLHVNGTIEVSFTSLNATPNTVVWNPTTRVCTGSCHNEPHDDRWFE